MYFLISFFWKKNSIFEEFTISKSKKIRAPLPIIAISCYPQTLVDFLLKLKSKRRRYSISNNCGCKEPSPFLPFFVVKAGRETHHRNSRWYRNTFGYYYGYWIRVGVGRARRIVNWTARRLGARTATTLRHEIIYQQVAPPHFSRISAVKSSEILSPIGTNIIHESLEEWKMWSTNEMNSENFFELRNSYVSSK